MPENTVSVARPHKWGNPYKVGSIDPRTGGIMDADTAVERYLSRILRLGKEVEIVRELRGKNLACFCRLGDPCHADVLLELANAPAAPLPRHRGEADR